MVTRKGRWISGWAIRERLADGTKSVTLSYMMWKSRKEAMRKYAWQTGRTLQELKQAGVEPVRRRIKIFYGGSP